VSTLAFSVIGYRLSVFDHRSSAIGNRDCNAEPRTVNR
jgi:hypothetical protein